MWSSGFHLSCTPGAAQACQGSDSPAWCCCWTICAANAHLSSREMLRSAVEFLTLLKYFVETHFWPNIKILVIIEQ